MFAYPKLPGGAIGSGTTAERGAVSFGGLVEADADDAEFPVPIGDETDWIVIRDDDGVAPGKIGLGLIFGPSQPLLDRAIAHILLPLPFLCQASWVLGVLAGGGINPRPSFPTRKDREQLTHLYSTSGFSLKV